MLLEGFKDDTEYKGRNNLNNMLEYIIVDGYAAMPNPLQYIPKALTPQTLNSKTKPRPRSPKPLTTKLLNPINPKPQPLNPRQDSELHTCSRLTGAGRSLQPQGISQRLP